MLQHHLTVVPTPPTGVANVLKTLHHIGKFFTISVGPRYQMDVLYLIGYGFQVKNINASVIDQQLSSSETRNGTTIPAEDTYPIATLRIYYRSTL